MKSEEIAAIQPEQRSQSFWLKEIAYQLAVWNESDPITVTVPLPTVQPSEPVKRGPGRPPKVQTQ